jgi:hypothetical protein
MHNDFDEISMEMLPYCSIEITFRALMMEIFKELKGKLEENSFKASQRSELRQC